MHGLNKSAQKFMTFDAVAITIGIVIGAGIFKTPSLVAAEVADSTRILMIWGLGGLISLLGAFCFAELASTYPDQGGDYFYLSRAYGKPMGFLFAWSRMTVIQTGSIAMLAFLAGDYVAGMIGRPGSSTLVAAGFVIALTALNAAGFSQGNRIQKSLVFVVGAGLLLISFFALNTPAHALPVAAEVSPMPPGAIGKVLIFVLLTYGGWNEAVYLSAEMERKSIIKVFIYSIAFITAIYMVVNIAFMRGLGIAAMAGSDTAAADLMEKALGKGGAGIISLLIAIAALATINGTLITGARSAYAVGRDFKLLGFLGKWNSAAGVPRNAVLFNGAASLMLVAFGSFARDGFSLMVEFTAPVFWFFFLLSTFSLFIFRKREPDRQRPFKVPLFPLIPIVFFGICLFMLVSSLRSAAAAPIAGVLIVSSGIPLLLLNKKKEKT